MCATINISKIPVLMSRYTNIHIGVNDIPTSPDLYLGTARLYFSLADDNNAHPDINWPTYLKLINIDRYYLGDGQHSFLSKYLTDQFIIDAMQGSHVNEVRYMFNYMIKDATQISDLIIAAAINAGDEMIDIIKYFPRLTEFQEFILRRNNNDPKYIRALLTLPIDKEVIFSYINNLQDIQVVINHNYTIEDIFIYFIKTHNWVLVYDIINAETINWYTPDTRYLDIHSPLAYVLYSENVQLLDNVLNKINPNTDIIDDLWMILFMMFHQHNQITNDGLLVLQLLLSYMPSLNLIDAKYIGSTLHPEVIQTLNSWYIKYGTQIPKSWFILTNIDQCSSGSEYPFTSDSIHKVPIIGYGNPVSGYVCFDLADLITLWENGEFRNPYNHGESFDIDTIEYLKYVIEKHPDLSTDEQIQEFDRFFHNYKLQKEHTSEIIENLRKVNPTYLRQLWVYLFAIGMYFRQWKGPGHPYPLSTEYTGSEFRDYCLEETQLLQVINILNQRYITALENLRQFEGQEVYQWYQSLPEIGIYNQRLEIVNNSIENMYNQTINQGDLCIRMISTSFVSTGSYYLKNILNETIPGYKLFSMIDNIQ